MKSQFCITTLGVAALLASCSGSGSDQANNSAPVEPNSTQAAAPISKAQSFPNPVTQPTTPANMATVPGLLKPTNAQARLPMITTGRRDPFATVDTPPIPLPPNSTASSVLRRSPGLPPLSTNPLPPLPRLSPGALPTVSLNSQPGSLPLPPTTMRPAPFSRTALADAIEVTGAIQVKGKWNVIVKEPGSSTSRYVGAGDYVANGKVLIKRIIAGTGADPVVVLQQNGVEVIKTLGRSTGVS